MCTLSMFTACLCAQLPLVREFFCSTCMCVCACAQCACADRKWRAGVSSLSMLPTYPLFNWAVSMVMNEGIATWMIGANPRVIGLIMDTHFGEIIVN